MAAWKSGKGVPIWSTKTADLPHFRHATASPGNSDAMLEVVVQERIVRRTNGTGGSFPAFDFTITKYYNKRENNERGSYSIDLSGSVISALIHALQHGHAVTKEHRRVFFSERKGEDRETAEPDRGTTAKDDDALRHLLKLAGGSKTTSTELLAKLLLSTKRDVAEEKEIETVEDDGEGEARAK